jgi:curved DNA-binding protein CbpA
MTLYETLGVAPDADATTIKQAYRRKAMEHHPDRGGDKATAAAINDAYAVLSDPARRQHYDETGSTDQKPGIEAKARQALTQLINEVIDHLDRGEGDDLHVRDPLEAVRDQLDENERTNARAIKQLQRRIEQREVVLGRLVRKGGDTLLLDALTGAIAHLRGEIAKAEQLQDLLKAVRDLLEGYDYKADAPTQASAADFEQIFRSFRFGP